MAHSLQLDLPKTRVHFYVVVAFYSRSVVAGIKVWPFHAFVLTAVVVELWDRPCKYSMSFFVCLLFLWKVKINITFFFILWYAGEWSSWSYISSQMKKVWKFLCDLAQKPYGNKGLALFPEKLINYEFSRKKCQTFIFLGLFGKITRRAHNYDPLPILWFFQLKYQCLAYSTPLPHNESQKNKSAGKPKRP